ncbi:hypothetical protein Salat_1742600 [Sesamum alatum]|uniref:Uncharacterized protein n=1 Tax=Sesamum alatum TaxID=300844 RepID=A0AAE1Y882_9LAMI|nr:hypothetical protein Salat_1742600 [Sesamum alatum]
MPPDRSWIMNRVGPGGYGITDEFRMGVKGFIELANNIHNVETRSRDIGRNDNVNQEECNSGLSVFNVPSRLFSLKSPSRILTPAEKAASTIYVMLNCPEIIKYVERYDAEKHAQLPDLTPKALGVMRDKEFASWFFNYVENPTNRVTDNDIRLFHVDLVALSNAGTVIMRTRGRGGRMLFDGDKLNSYADLLVGNTNHLLDSDSDRSDSRDVAGEEDEVHARENSLPCVSEQQIQDDPNDKDTIEHDEKGREILVIDGKCFVSVAAPRVMLEDLRGWYRGVWPTFSKIPKSIQKDMFARFKGKFTWRTPWTEEQVFKIWKSYFSRTMSGEMRRIRVAAGSRSVPPPAWMRQDLWEGLWDIWETRSQNGGKPVSFQEVFDRTHRRNKGKGPFVDQKSKKISDAYEVWAEVSGGPRNGRCYGFGSSYSGNVSYYSHSLGTVSSQVEMEQYKERIQELERQQRELQEMNSNFDQKVQNVVSSVLAAYGIFPGQHVSAGQCINPGRFSHFSAPSSSYFQPLVPPSYFPPPASSTPTYSMP